MKVMVMVIAVVVSVAPQFWPPYKDKEAVNYDTALVPWSHVRLRKSSGDCKEDLLQTAIFISTIKLDI